MQVLMGGIHFRVRDSAQFIYSSPLEMLLSDMDPLILIMKLGIWIYV